MQQEIAMPTTIPRQKPRARYVKLVFFGVGAGGPGNAGLFDWKHIRATQQEIHDSIQDCQWDNDRASDSEAYHYCSVQAICACQCTTATGTFQVAHRSSTGGL